MKLETAKSLALTVLVGVSLLVTLGLWNFKPDYPSVNNQIEVDMDIGGREVTQKDIVEPESIMFHQFNNHYGFKNPQKRQSLYRDMQSWVLYNFGIKESNGAPSNDYQVELIFPDALSMGIVKTIFKLNEEDTFLPDWSFKRMFITFDLDSKALKVHFLSENEQKQAIASVNNAEKYDLLWQYVTTHKDLKEYVTFDDSDSLVYIPKDSMKMTQRSFTVTTTDTDQLVDALFNKPSIVSRSNIGEPYFTDSISGMRLRHDGKLMELTSPQVTSNDERMNNLDVLKYSVDNINEHMGWTGTSNVEEGWNSEYNFVHMDAASNRLTYRMFYNGYPVYNSNDLTKIEQEWHNLDLYQYQRPLFSLNNSLGGESVELQSGLGVTSYLQNHPKYKVDDIIDIKVGYDLSVQQSASIQFYVKLEPAWYINENGTWKKIDFGDEIPINKGGS
ncbi:YycH family regulatory protein [Virgibacillus ndiopensis]|uniref:YycH family regulatory protein n=1 Tax=Virgibacillus ndiopensis TaxID=2004408 RepID=UPI000C076CD7|nr:two-component system activity regulator YycH [Virgibacillus ndiopensis]